MKTPEQWFKELGGGAIRNALTPEVIAAIQADAKPQRLPMETAPKDGREILAVRETGIEIVHWDDDHYSKNPKPFWRGYGPWAKSAYRISPPTAWMPLPEL